MKKFAICYLLFAICAGAAGAAATCSKQSLNACIDSSCAINIGANPAARCQLCGTATAGDAPTGTGMQQLALGASSKNTLSERELRAAPRDPADRYAWTVAQCIKKIGGACTLDDVEDYDKLIEQSCRAAGLDMQFASAQKKATTQKTRSACESEISLCIRGDKRCGSGFTACKEDADFDKFFAACAVEATGCDQFTKDIRTASISARDNSIKNASGLLASIVAGYRTAREDRLNAAKEGCKSNASRDACVQMVCAENMRNKCASGFESEVSMANLLCKFHETACGRLK
ncbi:MAG: hypothetical protein FWF97_03915 [Alphaproteobacteria bacterium]|nr:hypothetical protein [Alphaproteobacteria bacterium]